MTSIFSTLKIPHLWSEDVLKLPSEIIKIYSNHLKTIGRYDEAIKSSPKDSDLIGGPSEEATMLHFTHRFASSAVRIEYLVLDPKGRLGNIPDDLFITLCDGEISILDIPCGTGAGIISLIGTIAELREKKAIVSLPLLLNVTAGDISETALQIYNELLNQIKPWLSQQGIHLSWNMHHWDAANTGTTSAIVDQWFKESKSPEEYLVLIAAFSGEAAKNFDLYERSFYHITERLYDKHSTILWVEPKWGKSETMFNKIFNIFHKIAWFYDENPDCFNSIFKWFHPIKKTIIDRGSISVKKYSHK
jgi:SAM-dependent methyltransferase